MEIYTIVMTKESFSDTPTVECTGSFVSGEKAKYALIGQIVWMAQMDNNLAFAMWNDENHGDFRESLCEIRPVKEVENYFMRDDSFKGFPADIQNAVMGYLAGEISEDEGSYHVYCSTAELKDATYRFDIRKNGLYDKED